MQILHSYAVKNAHPLNRGLISWWLNLPQGRLGGGLTFRDLMRRNDGTLVSMDAASWVGARGRPGGWGALDFDGASDSVDTNLADADKITGAMTVSCWARGLSGSAAFSGLGTMGLSGTRGFLLGPDDGDRAAFFIAENSTTLISAIGTGLTLSSSVWVFWTGVYTPSASVQIYQDGKILATNTTSIPASQFVSNSISLKIGERGDGNEFFSGSIDDIRIYNRALSAVEVFALNCESKRSYPYALNWLRRRVFKAPAAVTGNPWYYYAQQAAS